MDTYLSLTDFYRQSVRVMEEKELLASKLIHSDIFVRNAQSIQLSHCPDKVVNLKSQMPKTCRFGMSYAGWWRRKGEKLYHIVVAQGKVGLVGLPALSIMLGKYFHTEDTGIEVETSLVV